MGKLELEEIKQRVDIVELIGRYVALKPSGKGYKGRCPFHPDDTPSLYVSPEKGLWHCFGCGAGGDAIGFLMRIEHLSFREALERLAAEVGVELREEGERQRLLRVNAAAEAFFRERLRAPEGKDAREYLLSRGIGLDLWDAWGLGYAPASGDALLSALARHGVEELLKLGLVLKGERGYRDRFRDRIIFPLRDELGRTVAFAGRALRGEPKYLNTPNTPLFTKGTLLYGLDRARERIKTAGQAVLVEGYTDVISLHAAGVTEAVSSMGTSLTESQARRLSRYAQRVIIAYDADAAGESSTLRGIGILLDAGLEVGIAVLPEGEDPDSLVRNQGLGQLRAALEGAIPFRRFLLELLPRRFDLRSLKGKEAALELVRSLWEHIRDPLIRREWAQELSLLLELPEEEVWGALKGRISWGERESEPAFGPEEVVLRFLLLGKLGQERVSQLEVGDFSPQYQRIVGLWLERWREGKGTDPRSLTLELGPEDQERLSRILLWDVNFSDENKALEDAWQRFYLVPKLEKRLAELRERMSEAEKARDLERLRELSQKYMDLCRGKVRLSGGAYGG